MPPRLRPRDDGSCRPSRCGAFFAAWCLTADPDPAPRPRSSTSPRLSSRSSPGCSACPRPGAHPTARWPGASVGAGVFAWGLGQAVWTYYEVWLGAEVPFPSLADAGYLTFPLLAIARRRASTTPSDRARSGRRSPPSSRARCWPPRCSRSRGSSSCRGWSSRRPRLVRVLAVARLPGRRRRPGGDGPARGVPGTDGSRVAVAALHRPGADGGRRQRVRVAGRAGQASPPAAGSTWPGSPPSRSSASPACAPTSRPTSDEAPRRRDPAGPAAAVPPLHARHVRHRGTRSGPATWASPRWSPPAC